VTGVLSGDQIRRSEHLPDTIRKIGQITDGRGNN
jgi:hypothetical protein